MQLEHQVVRPQTGDELLGVPAFERVVEIVGQEDGLELRPVPDLLVPRRPVAGPLGPVVELLDGVRRDPIVGKSVKRAGDLQQPRVLDGIVNLVQVLRQMTRTDAGARDSASTRSAGIPAEWASSV